MGLAISYKLQSRPLALTRKFNGLDLHMHDSNSSSGPTERKVYTLGSFQANHLDLTIAVTAGNCMSMV